LLWEALTCAVLVSKIITGCGHSPATSTTGSLPNTSAAPEPVTILGQGTLGGVLWRVDLLRENDKICTQATVAGKQTGFGCDPPVSDTLPINFIVDGLNPAVLLVYGAAAPQVARLVSRTADSPQDHNVLLVKPSIPGYNRFFFAYATIPGTASDLIAFDIKGDQLFSGADKLRQSQNLTTVHSGR
jgi:hypothetical protein